MRWMIADVHGHLVQLHEVLAEIRKVDKDPQYIFLGDYVDRGPMSAQTVDFLIELEKTAECTFLMGNHDDVFRYLIGLGTLSPNHISDSDTPQTVLAWFSQHGMLRTFQSYGDRIKLGPEGFYTIPAEHMKFFDRLKMFYATDDAFACHGMWPYMNPPNHMPATVLHDDMFPHDAILWGRFNQEQLVASSRNWVSSKSYFGHTPVQHYHHAAAPYIVGGVHLIDTGVIIAREGRLCAMCVETDQVVYSATTTPS